MARIARLKDDYYVNFDDHYLYEGKERIVELNQKPLEILEYLSTYPGCYKRSDDIIRTIYRGFASYSTIRSHISTLRNYNLVLGEVIGSKNGAGYIYKGEKIREEYDGLKEPVIWASSQLLEHRPFYQDDALIRDLYERLNHIKRVDPEETITSMILNLLNFSYMKGADIPLKNLPDNTADTMIVIKEAFELIDIYCEGKHLSDIKTTDDLLELDEEKITLIFNGTSKPFRTSMWLSRQKSNMSMRHLVHIIFDSDRIFPFTVWGFFDKISRMNYNIKPLSVAFISPFGYVD